MNQSDRYLKSVLTVIALLLFLNLFKDSPQSVWAQGSPLPVRIESIASHETLDVRLVGIERPSLALSWDDVPVTIKGGSVTISDGSVDCY